MSKHNLDRFSVSVGPAPSGEGEIYQLRRADQKDKMLTADSFTLDLHEMNILLDFLLEQVELQKHVVAHLTAKGLVRPSHDIIS